MKARMTDAIAFLFAMFLICLLIYGCTLAVVASVKSIAFLSDPMAVCR